MLNHGPYIVISVQRKDDSAPCAWYFDSLHEASKAWEMAGYAAIDQRTSHSYRNTWGVASHIPADDYVSCADEFGRWLNYDY